MNPDETNPARAKTGTTSALGPAAAGSDSFLLQVLMDHIPDAIYFKDTGSRFLCINRAQARRFGLSDPTGAVGKTDADFFSPTHAAQALSDEQQVLRTGVPLVGIEELETWPDGTSTWVSTTKMPLRDAAGKIIGTFGISRDITPRKRAEQVLAERTRQLQQRNQQMEEELRMARELQIAMLPQRFPSLAQARRGGALEFFSFYYPSGAVSGDFFDVVELSPTQVGVFICDVMGHDVRAALITAMLRALVEDLSLATREPGQLLAQINRGLAGVFKQTGTTMFATAFYLIADVARRELRYASAAHPDPVHLRRDLGRVDQLGSDGHKKGPALGLFEQAEFPTCVGSLSPGDLVTLYTDGLTEAESPNRGHFTEAGLLAAVRRRAHLPSSQLLDELIAEIRQFSGEPAFADDVCLVGMEIKGAGTAVETIPR